MRHLILVHQKTKQDIEDYREIARRIHERTDDIRVFIAGTKDPDFAEAEEAYSAPSMTVAPMPFEHFKPRGGTVLVGNEYPKGYQYERMQAEGVPVPEWVRVTPDIMLDPEHWGPYVVVKPELGRKGSEIFITRTHRVRYKPPEKFPSDHPIHEAPLMAQRFVYTGKWPYHFRIVTFLGKCIMAWHIEQSHDYPPLEEKWQFDQAGGGISIVSNKRSSSYVETDDAGAIAVAEAAHRALPEVPLLGSDIVREAETGDYYVLECNPRGDAWLISSHIGRDIQRIHGLDSPNQFGAVEIATKVLIEETRRRAT
ncbi:MAG: hypothetical protein ACR2OM_15845 [Aestuariivirgaceae bacterium]